MTNVQVFCTPIQNKYLIHAPLHRLTALMNEQAMVQLKEGLLGHVQVTSNLSALVDQLQTPLIPTPSPRTSAAISPLFLGIIPTRGCNMGCHYCDFAAPKHGSPVMSLDMARNAIDAYFELLGESDDRHAEVHFFGGEPFFADRVVHFAVEYARWCAQQQGCSIRFEVTSNGLYNANRCQWIADNFDTIVLSLDGTPDIQDRHRPGINGRSIADVVIRNAKIFSESTIELIIRICVTSETVTRLPEIADWIRHEFRPSTVCIETLSLSHNAEHTDLAPPDPLLFAQYFDQTARLLKEAGIATVISTADMVAPRISFCPVGKDALIVSPEGAVNACYLLEKDWMNQDLDLRLGSLKGSEFVFSRSAINRIRSLSVDNRPLCANCMCRWYCAGGCHVNHNTNGSAGQYDDQCIQTRAITFTRLLRDLGQNALADQWLSNTTEVQASVMQKDDRLLTMGSEL